MKSFSLLALLVILLCGCASTPPNSQMRKMAAAGQGPQSALELVRDKSNGVSYCDLAYHGMKNYSWVKLAMDNGTSPDCATQLGGISLSSICFSSGCPPSVLQLLVDSGASLSAKSAAGNTLLDLALMNQQAAGIRILQARGALRTVTDAQIQSFIQRTSERRAREAAEDAEDLAAEQSERRRQNEQGNTTLAVMSGVLSGMQNATRGGAAGAFPLQVPMPVTTAKGPQQVTAVNQCIRVELYVPANNPPQWKFFNSCSAPVSVAWCDKPGCDKSHSQHVVPAGGMNFTFAPNKTQSAPGRMLACPVDTFNSNWACQTKR